MKGIEVKDLGENTFLFTFFPAGREEEGGGVMEEFVASKTIKEYEFYRIPIWVRVYKLPLGMMDYDTAESVGN
jgi:hypothetical protein